jgi:hypothetical protein
MTEEKVIGDDLTELFKDTSTKTLEFDHNDKTWRFTYRSITWQEHFQAIEEAWEVHGDSRRFNAAVYYEKMLLKALIKGPGNTNITPSYLRQFTSKIIGKLVTIVPSPIINDELQEAKKE